MFLNTIKNLVFIAVSVVAFYFLGVYLYGFTEGLGWYALPFPVIQFILGMIFILFIFWFMETSAPVSSWHYIDKAIDRAFHKHVDSLTKRNKRRRRALNRLEKAVKSDVNLDSEEETPS